MLIKLNTTIPFTCYSLYLVSHAYFISTNIGIVLNYFCLCFYCFAAQRHSNLRITQYLAYFEQIWTRVVLKQTQQSLSFTQLWLRINHSKPKVVNLSNLFIFLCVFLLLWLCSNYKKNISSLLHQQRTVYEQSDNRTKLRTRKMSHSSKNCVKQRRLVNGFV